MKVTVIGAGNMGLAFVKQLTRAGHQVSVTARDSSKASQVAADNPGATAVAVSDAAANADAVVLATGYADAVNALRSVGELAGKVVIDITNPLTDNYKGLTLGHSTSAAEEIAKAVPGAEVVKGFNTVFVQVLAERAELGGRKASVFVASDSARQTDRGGTCPEHGLRDGRCRRPAQRPLPRAACLFYIYLGYGAGLGTRIAPTWIRQA